MHNRGAREAESSGFQSQCLEQKAQSEAQEAVVVIPLMLAGRGRCTVGHVACGGK